jgi:hypothetical protein
MLMNCPYLHDTCRSFSIITNTGSIQPNESAMIGEMMGWMAKLRRLVIKVESISGPAMRLPLLALIQKACEKTPTHREFCSLLRDNRLSDHFSV